MKPILFSTPMVQAILAGRKTQTRRVIKPQPVKETTQFERFIETVDCGLEARFGNKYSSSLCDRKPQYKPGDILWVRETWQLDPKGFEEFPPEEWWVYKATDELPNTCTKWRPSIFMPREAARIFLKATNVRVERVHDITEDDARAEGLYAGYKFTETSSAACTAKQAFMWIWQRINGNESWLENPWAWVIEFERVEGLK